MVKFKSRLTRISAGVAGIAMVTAGLALSLPGSAQAQANSQHRTTTVSCANEGNGSTGGPHMAGSDWVKQSGNCAGLRAAAGAGVPLNNVCYTMNDLANQYVLLGAHTSHVIWNPGSGTCMGFRFINFYDLGGILYNAFQIGAGGDCLDEANNNVYNESCPANPLANEVWAQIPGPTGFVWQNEASGYNLTADQRTGVLVTAGGPATSYNQWILTEH